VPDDASDAADRRHATPSAERAGRSKAGMEVSSDL
jgi:hypothetical protein